MDEASQVVPEVDSLINDGLPDGSQLDDLGYSGLTPDCVAQDGLLPTLPAQTDSLFRERISSSSTSGSDIYLPQEPTLTLTDFRSAFPAITGTPSPPTELHLQDWSQAVPNLQTGRIALPAEEVGSETVFVNVKQYHCILRRRAQRAKAEAQNKLVKSRKPFLHKSRHEHANKRVRGPHGRFLTAAEKEALEKCSEAAKTPEEPKDSSHSFVPSGMEINVNTKAGGSPDARGLLNHKSNKESGRSESLI